MITNCNTMKLLDKEKYTEIVENIIHKETQMNKEGLNLTIKNIHKISGKGEIDFGGSERNDCELEEIETKLRNPDDDYGWWNLEPGSYLMEYNENLKDERWGVLQPLNRLTRNSAFHPTKFISEIKSMPLLVSGNGISIKENSRVSKILIFENSD